MARPAAAPIPFVAEITPFQLVVLVFLPFASGYFLSYYFRTVNAVLAGRLMSDLGLDAAQLGLITAAYFLIAAAAQLPLGFVLDRYGPRRVQSSCLLVAGIGAYLFANAHDIASLFVARGLIGFGVASALLAGLKALAMSCPPRRLGLFNGIFMSLGATGAIAASLPTEAILQAFDWRQLFLALAIAAFASAGLIWSFVPKNSSPTRRNSSRLPDTWTSSAIAPSGNLPPCRHWRSAGHGHCRVCGARRGSGMSPASTSKLSRFISSQWPDH